MEMGHVFILSLVFVTIVWTLTEAKAACGKGGRRYCSDEKPCPENFACLQGQHGQQKYCRYCPCALQTQCSTFTNHTVYCNCSDSPLTGPLCNCPPTASCGATCPKNYTLNTELCSCFYISNWKEDSDGAYRICGSISGHLVKITDAQKNKVIQSLISEDSWIGSYYSSHYWYWNVDSSNFEYENWYPGSPSGAEDKNCAIIQNLDGQWVNKDCNTGYHFVCEFIR